MEEELIICRCQEISKAEIEEAIRSNDLRTVAEVKRHTRAGMGLCQGKTCSCLVMGILAQASGQPRSAVRPDTHRPPVRAVSLQSLADWIQEDE